MRISVSLTLLVSIFIFSSSVSAGRLEDDLVAAIRRNEFERARQIFAANNIDPDFVIPETENGALYPGQTILQLAMELGHWELVEQMLERKPEPDMPDGAKQPPSTKKRVREADENDAEANANGVVLEEIEPNAEDVPNHMVDWVLHWGQNRASTDEDLGRRGAAVPSLFDDPEIAALLRNPVVPADNIVVNERVPEERELNPRAGNFYFDGPRGLGGFFGGGSLF